MKVTKIFPICLMIGFVALIFAGCTSSDPGASAVSSKSEQTEASSFSPSSNSSTSSFTNSYGTSTTICAHSGCTNYIAASGDTNCCTKHSNKCLNCGTYIDEDAMYCMSCLKKAVNSGSSSGSSNDSFGSSSKSSSSKSTTGAGGYDMPNESDKTFSDYVKRVDPELYDSLFK